MGYEKTVCISQRPPHRHRGNSGSCTIGLLNRIPIHRALAFMVAIGGYNDNSPGDRLPDEKVQEEMILAGQAAVLLN